MGLSPYSHALQARGVAKTMAEACATVRPSLSRVARMSAGRGFAAGDLTRRDRFGWLTIGRLVDASQAYDRRRGHDPIFIAARVRPWLLDLQLFERKRCIRGFPRLRRMGVIANPAVAEIDLPKFGGRKAEIGGRVALQQVGPRLGLGVEGRDAGVAQSLAAVGVGGGVKFGHGGLFAPDWDGSDAKRLAVKFFRVRQDVRVHKFLVGARRHQRMQSFPDFVVHQQDGRIKIIFIFTDFNVAHFYLLAPDWPRRAVLMNIILHIVEWWSRAILHKVEERNNITWRAA